MLGLGNILCAGFRCENFLRAETALNDGDYAATPNNLLTNFAYPTTSSFATHLALPFLTISIASIPRRILQAVCKEPWPLASQVRRFTLR